MPQTGPNSGNTGTAPGEPQTEEQWAQGLLQFIGSPANGTNDPRVQFLAAWATSEGTFLPGGDHGSATNPNNPLSITGNYGMPGEGAWNSNSGYPVQTFATAAQGYQALVYYLSNSNDIGILNALKNPSSTNQQLYDSVVNSNWNGGGKGGQNSIDKANAIRSDLGNPADIQVSTGQNYQGQTQGGGPQTTPSGGGPPQPILTQQQEQADINKIAEAGGIEAIDTSFISPNLLTAIQPEIQKYLSNPAFKGAIEKQIAEDYGFESWLLKDPQVAAVIVLGALGNWDNNTIVGQMEKTQWFQNHNDNQRNWLEISGTDPSTAKELLFQAQDKILATAKALGVQLTGGLVEDKNGQLQITGQLGQMAYTVASNSATAKGVISNRLGFTQEQIDAMVAGAYRFNVKQLPSGAGDAATLFDAFQKMSAQYMVPMGDNALGQHVQNAIHNFSGQGDFIGGAAAGFETYLKQQAVSMFPTMKSAIDAGMTPYQWTEPYRQMAGQVLEKNPNSINLTDPQYRWMIDQVDPKTNQRTVSTLSDAQIKLMNDPKFGYQYTQSARSMAYSLVDQLGQAFGKIGQGGL